MDDGEGHMTMHEVKNVSRAMVLMYVIKIDGATFGWFLYSLGSSSNSYGLSPGNGWGLNMMQLG